MISDDVGMVVRSPIDDKVWIAVPSGQWDIHVGAMHASTSLRKCKDHVEGCARTSFAEDPPIDFTWTKNAQGEWECEARWES